MKKEYINPEGVYRHPGFTRVVTVEGPTKLIFIAGQTAGEEETNKCVAPGDWRAQYIRVMENLEKQLKAVSATWDDMVYRRTFVVDMDRYMAVRRDPTIPKYGDPSKPSPGTLVGVTRLTDPNFLLEVDLLAVVPA